MRITEYRRCWLGAQLAGLLVASGASLSVASAALFATTDNSGNSIAAAASFPEYPAAVTAGSPSFYHRMDDAAGSVTAADSSGKCCLPRN